MSNITGDNVTYTSSQIVGAPGGQIYRDGTTGASTDVFPTTSTYMVSEYGVASADFDDESRMLSITNNGGFTITQQLGAGQSLIPGNFEGSYAAGTITVPGTGYTSGSTTGTGATSGATMTVTFTDTAGAVTSIDSIDAILTGTFQAGESVVLSGGSGTAAFTLIIQDLILPGQARLYEWVIADGSVPTMNIIIRSANSSETTGIVLASGDILVGQSDGQAAGVTPSGDISSISTTGAFTANSATVALLAGAQTFTGDKTFSGVANFGGATGELRLVETADGNTEYITLSAPADVTTNYTINFPAAQGGANTILQNDGSGNLSWVASSSGSLSYYYAYGPATSVAVTGTAATVDIDTGEIQSGSYSNTNGVVTVPTTGTYKISYTVQFESVDQAGGQRASFAAQILVGNGVGVLTGSIVECYMREQNSSLVRPSATKVILYTVTNVAETIAVQALRTIGTTTGQTRVNECTLTIEQVA